LLFQQTQTTIRQIMLLDLSSGNTYSLVSPELYVTAATGYTITPPT
jgi:hypothetical protein